ncbi:MAG: LysM peptidoglycan-binding domain-containing protein [Firmicutes bacterium]|nr:LysM peptidoglycan-binding domain-containing protein [Bacillota bacterium]
MSAQKKIILPILLALFLICSLAMPTAASATYQVQAGDSLFLIAQRYGTTVGALQDANGIYGNIIYPGEVLALPTNTSRVHQVQWGETLWTIAAAYGTTVAAIQDANGFWGTEIYAGENLVIPGGTSLTRSTTPASPVNSYVPSEELDLLARMIQAEAEGEPYIGKVAVGAVILNRVRDPRFPNTISGVLFAPWEFEPVMNDRFWQVTPSQESYNAAQDAMAGWDPTDGAVFFYNPAQSTSYWIFTRPVINQIGRHLFAL